MTDTLRFTHGPDAAEDQARKQMAKEIVDWLAPRLVVTVQDRDDIRRETVFGTHVALVQQDAINAFKQAAIQEVQDIRHEANMDGIETDDWRSLLKVKRSR